MKFMIDIDGTICTMDPGHEYTYAKPYLRRIHQINKLFDEGHEIHYWTARGSTSGKDWSEFTKVQLQSWGCKYTTLSLGKPSYDIWIDDKAIALEDFFND